MHLNPGQTLSCYEIIGSLGAGAMGEVYRARDVRLEREVAIKVLPDEFAQDLERLRRFEREAKTLATLNHPNIAGIYGVDQDSGTNFLALELVPGEDLAEILSRGRLPRDEALDVCRQIAEGLEAAHEANIVHRDLKPANIRITPEGEAKILDFGLAKPIVAQENKVVSAAAETGSVQLTCEGLVLGTPIYMSPEQARGKPVDRRTDIWAFGCVLYECLTGHRAFSGNSFVDVFAAIIDSDPDWTSLPALPPHLLELLRRCLTKDARLRLRDIGEARVQLLDTKMPETAVPKPRLIQSGLLLSLALLLGSLIGAGLIIGFGERRVSSESFPGGSVRLSIPATADDYIALTSPKISPDGKSVVFEGVRREDDKWGLWLRQLDSFDAQELPGVKNALKVFWSPDSKSIGFSDDGMKLLRLGDPSPRALPIEDFVSATWTNGNSIIYSQPEGPLWIIPIDGGEPEQLTRIDREAGEMWHIAPTFLPDGDRFLFLAVVRNPGGIKHGHRLYSGSLSKREFSFLKELPSTPWYTDRGELIYGENGQARSVSFDPVTLRFTGDPKTIATGVQTRDSTGMATLSVSRNGDIAFMSLGNRQEDIVWLDRNGFQIEHVVGPGSFTRGFRISPNGNSVAVSTTDTKSASRSDIWIHGLNRGTKLNLTDGYAPWVALPVWAPDGQSLFFASDRRGYPDLERVYLKSPGDPILVWQDAANQVPIDITPDGKQLLVASDDELWLIPVDGVGERQKIEPIARDGFRTIRFSPDGRFIAYNSRESGKFQVYVRERNGAERTIQISEEGGEFPVWGQHDNQLYFTTSDKEIWQVELKTDQQIENPQPKIVLQTRQTVGSFEVAPDGERFLVRSFRSISSPASILLRGKE